MKIIKEKVTEKKKENKLQDGKQKNECKYRNDIEYDECHELH